MPLLEGEKNLGKNIRELMSAGKPKKQAVAIALDKSRKTTPNAIQRRLGKLKKGKY